MIQARLILFGFCILVAVYLLLKPNLKITNHQKRTNTEDGILKDTIEVIINELKTKQS